MCKKYFIIFLFISSCATEKKITFIHQYENSEINSEQVSKLVGQTLNYYQRSSDSNICIPRSQYELDAEIENDLRKTKKILISKVLQHNQYYIDIVFSIQSRKDAIFLRIVLKDYVCNSFILEDFKVYDKQES